MPAYPVPPPPAPDAPDGWWNLHAAADGGAGPVRRVLPMAAEFCSPAWLFGQRPFVVLRSGRILALWNDPQQAGSTLALVDPATGAATQLATPFSASVAFSGPTLAVHEARRLARGRRQGWAALLPARAHARRKRSPRCSFPALPTAQAADGHVRVAAVAGSALQPLAVVLLEAASEVALADATSDDWALIEPSAATQVGGAARRRAGRGAAGVLEERRCLGRCG